MSYGNANWKGGRERRMPGIKEWREKKAPNYPQWMMQDIADYLDPDYGYVEYGPELRVTTQALYESYKEFCKENATEACPVRTFCNVMISQAENRKLRRSGNVYTPDGVRHRGYLGIGILQLEDLLGEQEGEE